MRILICLMAILVVFFHGVAFAEDAKIAMIDMDRIFKEYYKTKIADANMKKQAEVFKSYLEKLNDSKIKFQDEFKELRDASQNIGLSDAERESKRVEALKKYRQLQEKEAEAAQYNKEKKQQMAEEFTKNRELILADINKEVEKKSAIEGYAMVFDVSGKTLNDIPSVIYYNKKLDITDVILDELNRGHKVEKDKNAKSNVKTDVKQNIKPDNTKK